MPASTAYTRDRVHSVTGYHDGPMRGVADYRGRPHRFELIFDESQDEYSDVYRLTPLDDETAALERDAWMIWKRWEDAYYSGRAPPESGGVLPEDRAQHETIAREISARIVDAMGPVRLARGVFFASYAVDSSRLPEFFEVAWTDVEED